MRLRRISAVPEVFMTRQASLSSVLLARSAAVSGGSDAVVEKGQNGALTFGPYTMRIRPVPQFA
jgi:hypothetical protein